MKYFEEHEFNCPCCDEQHMQDVQLKMIDKARDLAGVPFSLNSAWRCVEHNEYVGGGVASAHLRGYACDISVRDSRSRFKIIKALLAVGFRRIGVYKTFIHCDTDPDLPQEVIWYS